MNEQIRLTPAQSDFIRMTFPGFDATTTFGELAGRAASSRYFIRIYHNGRAYILVAWDSHDEDWSRFLSLADARNATSFLLPEVYASDPQHGLILEEDLGAVTLKKFCSNSNTRAMLGIYKRTLNALRHWQNPVLAAHPVAAAREMDSATFLWESSYFSRFCVTDFCGSESLLDAAWQQECAALAQECAALPHTVIHRDFQSENVLVHEGIIRFVDFQGARLGPPEYDVASLLFDPYIASLQHSVVYELYDYYRGLPGGADSSMRALQICAVQRLMQALGAYGNLSLHKGKEWYREFIPVALERLCGIVDQLDGFPRIREVVSICTAAVTGGNCVTSATGPETH